MSDILEVRGLTKRFGGLAAVSEVDFSVRQGGITGLIGPNGAGKTTIFNLITGVYKVTEPYLVADIGITRTFQNIRLFKNLTVFDNVLTACHASAGYNLADSFFRLPRFRREEKKLREKTLELLTISAAWK